MLERRVAWSALAFPAVGIALGLLINPYFPENVVFIAGHLLPKVGESVVPVGNEWSPYETWTLATNSAGALVAVLLGRQGLRWRGGRWGEGLEGSVRGERVEPPPESGNGAAASQRDCDIHGDQTSSVSFLVSLRTLTPGGRVS